MRKENFFNILGIERKEKAHSKFLEWIFKQKEWNKDIDLSPVVRLIRICLDRAEKQGKFAEFTECDDCEKSLKDFLDCETISFELGKSGEVKTEKSTRGIRLDNTKGYIDLYIKGYLSGPNGKVPLHIILENKIDNKEQHHQTWKYYMYFSHDNQKKIEECKWLKKEGISIEFNKKNGSRQGPQYKCPTQYGDFIVFAFLTPHSDEQMEELYEDENNVNNKVCPECKHFIHITYQDLYNNILKPLVNSPKVEEFSRMKLKEYMETLSTIPVSKYLGKFKIMAEDPMKVESQLYYNPTKSQKDTVSDKTQSEAFGQVANGAYELLDKIDADDQIRKVKLRVPGWKNRPHQINSKILAIFMELSGNGKNGVFVDMLQDEFETRYPEERGNFTKYYNQMRNNGYKNHDKVFYEDNEQTVWLWSPVRDFVIKAYSKIRYGSNDPDSVRAVENKIKSDSTKFRILYYKGKKKVIKETNQTHLLSDLIKLHMQNDDATREDIEKLFEGEKWQIFCDDKSVTGYDRIKINGKTYRVSNQRTRNPEYRQTIISMFGRKGYEVRLK